jgi:hypothetical protein
MALITLNQDGRLVVARIAAPVESLARAVSAELIAVPTAASSSLVVLEERCSYKTTGAFGGNQFLLDLVDCILDDVDAL